MKKAILLALTLLLSSGTGVAWPFGTKIGMKMEEVKGLEGKAEQKVSGSPYLDLTLLK